MSDNEQAFSVAYATKLAEAVARHPEEYLYGPDEVPKIVNKMVRALVAGTAHVSPAVKAAAHACGVRQTAKAIREFLSGGASEPSKE